MMLDAEIPASKKVSLRSVGSAATAAALALTAARPPKS